MIISILGYLVKILAQLQVIEGQNQQILLAQNTMSQQFIGFQLTLDKMEGQLQNLESEIEQLQADVDVIKKVLGIGVPVAETIIFGQPKP